MRIYNITYSVSDGKFVKMICKNYIWKMYKSRALLIKSRFNIVTGDMPYYKAKTFPYFIIQPK